MYLQSAKAARNVPENIEVANSEEDHIGKSRQGAKSGCTVLDDLDDTVETFGDGIGKRTFNEGKNVVLVKLQRGCKSSH
jgi:hypothetical protein